ncbi:MAG: sulfotransferase family protein [Planctomycetaceae bacterium]|nr:sulfotransferase family protein [Planctomycetaceae bacterium]
MRDFTTVVSGLPRSGTSMAMQMIVAGGIAPLTDGLRTADADNPRGYFEFERVKALRTDKAWLDEARGKVVKVIHMLVPELPDDRPYRVVFLDRDVREVVKSQTTMLARSGKSGGGLPPDRLAAIYTQQLAQVHAWLAARPNFTVLAVRHADLIADARAQAARIAGFLAQPAAPGLDLDAMTAAVDPSLHRNRT